MTRIIDQPEGDDPVSPQPQGSAIKPEHFTFWNGSLAIQRSIMRELYNKIGHNPDVVCSAYVEAEHRCGIARARGAENLDPHLHARLLWREGLLKGWLRQ